MYLLKISLTTSILVNRLMLTPLVVVCMLAATLIISTGTSFATVSAQEQQLQQQPSQSDLGLTPTAPLTTTPPTMTIYQSNADGFRIGVVDGWIIDDSDNTLDQLQDAERQLGFGLLARICPQEQALRSMNGTYVCPQEADPALRIIRFGELSTRPEYAAAVRENGTITISDFYESATQFVENFGLKDFKISGTHDATINVIDPQTNQTVATAPLRHLVYTFTITDSLGRDFEFFGAVATILSNDTNTGYLLFPIFSPASHIGNLSYVEIGEQLGQVADSFELLSAP
jgi:hypothetical protein